jgi:hypothetical protein
MSEFGITIAIIVIVIVAATDIIVRLRIAPRRRDEFLENLLNSMIESEPIDPMMRAFQVPTRLDESLGESLLRHFELSTTSRQVLEVLARRSLGMSEIEVLSAVNRQLAFQRKRELPPAVMRKVVKILIAADLLERREGKLQIAEAGRQLINVLQARTMGISPAAAFASP